MSDDVHALAERFYDCSVAPQAWADALALLAAATGGVGAIVVPVCGAATFSPIWSPSLDESGTAYVRGGWWERDTRAERGRALGLRSGLHLDVDFVGPDRIARDPFYQEFLAPFGFGCALSQVVSPPGGPVIAITVQREAKHGLFTAAERHRLEILGQHAGRALATSFLVSQAARDLAAEQTAREHQAHGYLLLDGAGGVVHADALGRRLIGPVFGLSVKRLSIRNGTQASAFERAIDAVMKGELPPPAIAVTRPGRVRPDLIIQILAAPRTGAWTWGPGRVLVLIHDLAAEGSAQAQRHFIAMGLTPGQAKIAQLIGGGHTPREAAEALGLAEATVRTVLKSIYARLAIRRQSELATLAAKLQQIL
ncbi:LuxR C-terminal-related transcriptional regulator [Alsobacter sp. KACC 23698]|uniref:LuxR C-terminal-related transcriptional regulator n=1 Tax=Alsobacter sp. KACC 23698 TaxID=3149229 RepID=A0AAU7JK80_9HYPH